MGLVVNPIRWCLCQRKVRMRTSKRKNFTEECLHFGRWMSVIDAGKPGPGWKKKRSKKTKKKREKIKRGKNKRERYSGWILIRNVFPLINQTTVSFLQTWRNICSGPVKIRRSTSLDQWPFSSFPNLGRYSKLLEIRRLKSLLSVYRACRIPGFSQVETKSNVSSSSFLPSIETFQLLIPFQLTFASSFPSFFSINDFLSLLQPLNRESPTLILFSLFIHWIRELLKMD